MKGAALLKTNDEGLASAIVRILGRWLSVGVGKEGNEKSLCLEKNYR